MDWLIRPLLLFALFTCVFGKECLLERCSNAYQQAMDESGLDDAEASQEYCDIIKPYHACLKNVSRSCRGDLTYHATSRAIETVVDKNCRAKNHSNSQNKNQDRPKPAEAHTRKNLMPSCRYFGSYKFRHCGFYGDPHLKTFSGLYQTCRVSGKWTLIDNPYMTVEVTSQPVTQGSQATAPTKIVVVINGHTTPCTLEKRYEANSGFSLSAYFTDGTFRSGLDETVTLHHESNPQEDMETVAITLRYVASRLIIRRKGKYLAFNAKLPVELITKSDDDNKVELCSTGCPNSERLSPMQARGHVIEREEALRLCKSEENLTANTAVNLTDNYLDWCVFDVMTAGRDKDLIDAAHLAQNDTLILDPSSLQNRTTLLEIPYDSRSNNGASSAVFGSFVSFQLPVCIFSLILTCGRFLTSL